METPLGKLLNQKEVAEILGMSEAWLEQSRFRKTGLPFCKIGKSVRYRQEDVQAWINSHVIGTGI